MSALRICVFKIFVYAVINSPAHVYTNSDLCDFRLICKFFNWHIKRMLTFRHLSFQYRGYHIHNRRRAYDDTVNWLIYGNAAQYVQSLRLWRACADSSLPGPDPVWSLILGQLYNLKTLTLNIDADDLDCTLPLKPAFSLTQLNIKCSSLDNEPRLGSFLSSQSDIVSLNLSMTCPCHTQTFTLPAGSLQHLRSLTITTRGYLGYIPVFRDRNILLYREFACSAMPNPLRGLESVLGLSVKHVPTPESSRYDLALPNLRIFEGAAVPESKRNHRILANYVRRMPELRILCLVYSTNSRPLTAPLKALFRLCPNLQAIHFINAPIEIYHSSVVPPRNVIPYTLRRAQRRAVRSPWDATACQSRHPLLSARISYDNEQLNLLDLSTRHLVELRPSGNECR